MTIKKFRQFLREDTIKTYLIELNPYIDESGIRETIFEMVGWCLYYTERGQSVLLTARPLEDTVSEGVKS